MNLGFYLSSVCLVHLWGVQVVDGTIPGGCTYAVHLGDIPVEGRGFNGREEKQKCVVRLSGSFQQRVPHTVLQTSYSVRQQRCLPLMGISSPCHK